VEQNAEKMTANFGIILQKDAVMYQMENRGK